MLYLPRFAMNENFGGIGRFKLAVNALPLAVTEVTPADPLLLESNNLPILGFTVKELRKTAVRTSLLRIWSGQSPH